LRFPQFPDIFPEIVLEGSIMANAQQKALSSYRRRMKQQGIVRLEVRVRKDDAVLVRNVVNALDDPVQASDARALLRERFGTGKTSGLKALLAAAPLEGIDIDRDRDFGRELDL